MKPNKFTEIKNRLAYIQDLLDEAVEIIKEAELSENINRGVEVSTSVLLAGGTASDLDEYEGYCMENTRKCWKAFFPAICVVGILLLLALIPFIV